MPENLSGVNCAKHCVNYERTLRKKSEATLEKATLGKKILPSFTCVRVHYYGLTDPLVPTNLGPHCKLRPSER